MTRRTDSQRHLRARSARPHNDMIRCTYSCLGSGGSTELGVTKGSLEDHETPHLGSLGAERVLSAVRTRAHSDQVTRSDKKW